MTGRLTRLPILHPVVRHAEFLTRTLLAAGMAGSVTNHAHRAALAIERDAEWATFDRDFQRFSGLK